MPDKITLDTTIVIYAFGRPDDVRERIAKEIITKCNVISLQVFNETILVLQKNSNFLWKKLRKWLNL
jgi:predicted nucleic acid-binding protein